MATVRGRRGRRPAGRRHPRLGFITDQPAAAHGDMTKALVAIAMRFSAVVSADHAAVRADSRPSHRPAAGADDHQPDPRAAREQPGRRARRAGTAEPVAAGQRRSAESGPVRYQRRQRQDRRPRGPDRPGAATRSWFCRQGSRRSATSCASWRARSMSRQVRRCWCWPRRRVSAISSLVSWISTSPARAQRKLKSSLDSDLADLQAQRQREQAARDAEVTTRDQPRRRARSAQGPAGSAAEGHGATCRSRSRRRAGRSAA